MHKDTKEALERLERELLATEKPKVSDADLDLLIEDILFDEEPEEIPDTIRTYNTDEADLDLDHYSDEVYEAPEKGWGELWFALTVLVAIAGIMIWWAVSML